jgi:osmoprotectant transport system ATP-binding protein
VRDFVGGADAVLKLLDFRTIGDFVRHGVGTSGDPVPASTTLRSALTRMMAEGRSALPVADGNGRPLGIIHIDSILAASKVSCGA